MDLRVSSPCPISWDTMRGDDRIRFCGHCKLNVYNLAVMSRGEVDAILRKTGGNLCGRLYVRGDRTATLQDCPRGSARRRIRRAFMVLAGLALATFAWMLKETGDRDRSAHPVWIQTVLNWIDPEPEPPPMLVGRICPTTPPAPPPPPPANP